MLRVVVLITSIITACSVVYLIRRIQLLEEDLRHVRLKNQTSITTAEVERVVERHVRATQTRAEVGNFRRRKAVEEPRVETATPPLAKSADATPPLAKSANAASAPRAGTFLTAQEEIETLRQRRVSEPHRDSQEHKEDLRE